MRSEYPTAAFKTEPNAIPKNKVAIFCLVVMVVGIKSDIYSVLFCLLLIF